MRPYLPAPLLLAIFCLSLLTACGDEDKLDFQTSEETQSLALIEVYQPVNGSVLPAKTDFIVDYAVVRGLEGQYVVIRMDGQNPMRINSLNSRHQMKGLAPGKHALLIEEYAADGKKTGGRARIEFTVE